MEYNSGSNRASNLKLAERVARGWFEITSTITPELYDTKSYYQLIVSITKCKKLTNGIFDVGIKLLLQLLIARFVVL